MSERSAPYGPDRPSTIEQRVVTACDMCLTHRYLTDLATGRTYMCPRCGGLGYRVW